MHRKIILKIKSNETSSVDNIRFVFDESFWNGMYRSQGSVKMKTHGKNRDSVWKEYKAVFFKGLSML